jgi:hypothetical protein
VRLETDSQKDDVRLDRFRQRFGNVAKALARAWPILPKPMIA